MFILPLVIISVKWISEDLPQRCNHDPHLGNFFCTRKSSWPKPFTLHGYTQIPGLGTGMDPMNGHGKFCLVGVPNLLVPKKNDSPNGFVGFKIVSLGAFQLRITYFFSEGKNKNEVTDENIGISWNIWSSGVFSFLTDQMVLYNPIYPIYRALFAPSD